MSINIEDYAPGFISELQEMSAIYQAEDVALEQAESDMVSILDGVSPLNANTDSQLQRLEHYYGLPRKLTESLTHEQRRQLLTAALKSNYVSPKLDDTQIGADNNYLKTLINILSCPQNSPNLPAWLEWTAPFIYYMTSGDNRSNVLQLRSVPNSFGAEVNDMDILAQETLCGRATQAAPAGLMTMLVYSYSFGQMKFPEDFVVTSAGQAVINNTAAGSYIPLAKLMFSPDELTADTVVPPTSTIIGDTALSGGQLWNTPDGKQYSVTQKTLYAFGEPGGAKLEVASAAVLADKATAPGYEDTAGDYVVAGYINFEPHIWIYPWNAGGLADNNNTSNRINIQIGARKQ
ncbi:MAG: hypothetical protein LBQ80_04145 [Clostridium sp.]|jgi:hypothetical protein|nr:hypothetical protein [Clostridium sp.]